MRTIIREIERNRNLDTNLVKYAAGMEDNYRRYSKVRLAMNYFSLYERMEESVSPEAFIDSLPLFHSILKESILETPTGEQRENAIQTLRGMRDGIIETMKTATVYTDIFYLYEYVLNRIEYRFKETDVPSGYTDEDFTRELMRYIVADEDQAVINSKICEVIGQLPIRLTKQKFFEYLNNGLSVYIGSDHSALDDFLYRIRTSATLDRPDDISDELTELTEIRDMLKDADFVNLTNEEYETLSVKLREATDYLSELTDSYVSVTELINDALVILLADVYQQEKAGIDKVADACTRILSEVCGCFQKTGGDIVAASDFLVFLEGEQERLSEQINANEYLIHEWYDTNKEPLITYNLLKRFCSLRQMSDLTSGSVFAELATESEGEIAVDEVYLQEKKDILYDDFTAFFGRNPRPVTRAVMATVIAQLPVFFQNISELQDFIYQCLSQCRDKAEKLACIEILNGVMDEADD